MKRLSILWALALLFLISSSAKAQQSERIQLLVETSKGDFIIELFDETPLHRDRFLSFVDQKAFDGTLFHRVIKDFMIQGGNTLSRGVKPQDELPDDSSVGTTPAEFRTDLFIHERGMLGAARRGDEDNPEKASSATQFYIVTGTYYTDFDLDQMERSRDWKYTLEQREALKMRGGAAHLDGTYTVFGRLVDGWKTVDKIQRVDRDEETDRPIKNIVIKQISRYQKKGKK